MRQAVGRWWWLAPLRSKAFVIVLAAASVLLPGKAIGEELNHRPFEILSEGASTCGEYVAEPEKQIVRMEWVLGYKWVLGYISGANSRAPSSEAMAGSSFQMPVTVLGWLKSYCTSHPLEAMVTAAETLRRDFLAYER